MMQEKQRTDQRKETKKTIIRDKNKISYRDINDDDNHGMIKNANYDYDNDQLGEKSN